MKSKLLLLLAVCICSLSNGQTKVGTVNSEYIIGKMPQMKQVIERVNNYAQKLDSTFAVKATDYKTKIEAFNAVEKTLTEADRKVKINEITGLENDMNSFRKNGSQLIQLRKDEYLRPLYKKVAELITEIAKANGYTQILTTSGNEFAFIDEKFDITKQVLDKLGIKE